MKLTLSLLAVFGVGGIVLAADAPPAAVATVVTNEKPAAIFKDTRDKVSYAIGVNVAGVKAQGFDVNPDQLGAGLRDALAGQAKLTDAEVRETIKTWQMETRAKQLEKMKLAGDVNKKAGEAWLAANAQKPNVKTMPDGLQYKVLVPGKGPQPKAGDRVSAHYKGSLTDGTQFDSSYERGTPFVTSTLGGVIPGWLEVLTNMHVGDKWEVYIPGPLAYGEAGRPPTIPPSATLIFEMELLGIEPPAAPGAGQIKIQPGK